MSNEPGTPGTSSPSANAGSRKPSS
jgi:hypothetical protein